MENQLMKTSCDPVTQMIKVGVVHFVKISKPK